MEGNCLPFAPEWQVHLGIAYTAHAGSIDITPRVDASFQPTTFFDATNTPEIAQLDDVTTVNAAVQFSGKDVESAWTSRWASTTPPTRHIPIAGNSSLTTGSGYAEIAYSRPLEWFASFQYDF